MQLRFIHQARDLIAHGGGEAARIEDARARDLIARGAAVERGEPAPIREAVSSSPSRARKAVSRS